MDPAEHRIHNFDTIFWNSAIFSREAMVKNCVSPHKYGDKMALGVYRIVAFVLMLILFVFLTLYENIIARKRFYLTFVWYVSLGTLVFFGLSLVNYKAYFQDAEDASSKA